MTDPDNLAPESILRDLAAELAREMVNMDRVDALREELGVTQEELEEMFEGGLE